MVVIICCFGITFCGCASRDFEVLLERVGEGCDFGGELDRSKLFVCLACVSLLLFAVVLYVVVSQPLGSRAAKMSAVVGVVILLAVPANRVVADILAVARHSAQGVGKLLLLIASPRRRAGSRVRWRVRCAAVVGSVRLSESSFSCSPPLRRPLLLPQLLPPRV